MTETRTVIDTGVAVSAVLLPRSVPGQALDAAMSRGRILVSEATAVELEDVFRRPKFNKYVPEQTRLDFLAALLLMAEPVEITETITACRDPKDDKFLELAVSGLLISSRCTRSAESPSSRRRYFSPTRLKLAHHLRSV